METAKPAITKAAVLHPRIKVLLSIAITVRVTIDALLYYFLTESESFFCLMNNEALSEKKRPAIVFRRYSVLRSWGHFNFATTIRSFPLAPIYPLSYTLLSRKNSPPLRALQRSKRIRGAEGSRIRPLDFVELLKRFLFRNRLKCVEVNHPSPVPPRRD
jgi:hypothetical protein